MTLDEYIAVHTSPENEALEAITRDTHVHVLNPHMLSGQVQGRLLSMLSHMIQPKRILELGTFTGYSALCLAEGLAPDGRLITIEHNDELEETLRRNLSRSPLGSKIDLIIGDCKSEIGKLEGPFELVFIDADKREYCEYLELVYPLVPVGGFILADNTLWDIHLQKCHHEANPYKQENQLAKQLYKLFSGLKPNLCFKHKPIPLFLY